MKRNKSGISLIVLVITIIVMVILAAAIIISLDNAGVINKANEAVDKTNVKEVQQLATLVWSEEYMDGKRGEALKEDVLDRLKDYTGKYDIDVTDKGVTVVKKDDASEDTDEVEPGVTPTITLNATTITETIESGATKEVTLTATTANVTETLVWSSNNETVATVVGNESTATVTLNGEGTATITATANGVSATCSVTVTIEAVSTGTTLGSLITAANYGDTVNYEANGVTDWKIFYHTEDYVYLIASEKLAYDKVPTKLTDTIADGGAGATITSATVTLADSTTRTVGQVYWASGSAPSSAATIENPTKWMANWGDYSTNTNGKCVSYFLDETYWTGFKNTTASYASYVEGAIGTPTAEMFVASWNAKRLTETNTSKVELTLSEKGTTGYYINGSTTLSIGTSDPLYIWSTASNSSTWLASPSGSSTSYLLLAGGDGYVYGSNYNDTYRGVRPVVCLKSNIPANAGTTTDFEI